MINLRPYQNKAIETIKNTFQVHDRQYIEMPTGSGKTMTFLDYASTNHDSVLIIVPSKELLKQVYSSALLFYHKSEISRKGANFNEPIKKLHICVINSIRGNYLDFLAYHKFDLTIIDEAHHSMSMSYKRFIDLQSKFNLSTYDNIVKYLGVTATPDRVDRQVLSDILGKCSFKLEISEMIEGKYLCDIEGFCVKTKIDISDIDDHNGDFSISQLFKKLSCDSRNNMIVRLVSDEMKGRKTLVFCINIKHSLIITDMLKKNGISAVHIDGTMNSAKRSEILSSFRNGIFDVLCNCQLLTEGFDEPSIDGIILSRPTRSKSLFLQMIGRGLRIFPGKSNCKIVDIVDNHKLLSSFNNILTDDYLPPIEKFRSIKDIRSHVNAMLLEITEFSIERANLLNQSLIQDYEATASMLKYLGDNNINFFEPISFDEASFLIWYNELKKRYKNGKN